MKKIEQALLYGFNDMARLERTRKVLNKLGIAVKVLEESAWREKIGYLLGMNGFKGTKTVEDDNFVFPHEVMVLQNIRNKRLDEVLASLQQNDLGDIKFKSVVTPFNTLWTLRRLCETMQREHSTLLSADRKMEQK